MLDDAAFEVRLDQSFDFVLAQQERPDFLAPASSFMDIEELIDDAFSPSGSFVIADDDWWAEPVAGKGSGWGQPQFNGGGSTGSTPPGYPLPPVDSAGSEMTDAEIEEIINSLPTGPGTGPSTGGGGGGATDSLGPNLTIYNCAMLSQLEGAARDAMANFRLLAIPALAGSHQGNGEVLFGEYWNAFQDIDARGLWDPQNPFGNVSRVYAETGNGQNQLSTSLLSLGFGLALDWGAIELVQSAYAAFKQIQRIDAEQARRGSCGG